MRVFIFLVAAIYVCQAVVPQINKDAEVKVEGPVFEKSCLDYLRMGVTKNGFYSIKGSGVTLTVYCDFKSEPGMAWTLVMSWSYQNKNLPAFRSLPITMNSPVNDRNPNLEIYRLALTNTQALKAQSTHWRATCSFQFIHEAKTLYRDYIRGKFADFDIMTYNGQGICKKVEYVNIRGHVGYSTLARFWQVPNSYMLHIDSTAAGCAFYAGAGAVSSEDNFGFYGSPASKSFRCTNHLEATTNWWFGSYL